MRPPILPDPFLLHQRTPSDPSPHKYDPGLIPGFVPPQGRRPHLPRGTVLHTHIVPTFARKVDLDEFGIPKRLDIGDARKGVEKLGKWASDPWSGDAANPWHKSFTPTLHTTSPVSTASPASPASTTAATLTIHPPPPTSTFPHHAYRLVLTLPQQGILSRWECNVTPFSFQTVAKRAGWDTDEKGQRVKDGVLEGLYTRFAAVVKERVCACVGQPERFTSSIVIRKSSPKTTSATTAVTVDTSATTTPPVAILTFSEMVQNYRRVELLTLDFSPVVWGDMVDEVRGEFARMEAHYTLSKTALIQSLELVARHQPSLLFGDIDHHGDWEDALAGGSGPAPSVAALYGCLHAGKGSTHDPADGEENEEGAEKNEEVVCVKSIPIRVVYEGSDDVDGTVETVTLTLCAKEETLVLTV
ncbi:hypothetical protein HK104_008825 [Borealophlyctis nickersoniae]|nr:hypothetical protein HK104_008825 [Borealophlyctis nickersoniae]